LMDKRIRGWIVVSGLASRSEGLLSFHNPCIDIPDAVSPDLPCFTICSLDIETSVRTGELLSIAADLQGPRVSEQRVFMRVPGRAVPHFLLTYAGDEKDLLRPFDEWF